MPKEYTKEQLRKLYLELPEELQEAIFSLETVDSLYDICERNDITENKQISEIARWTGQVLLGILPLDEFQKTLEKEVKLKKDLAKKVIREINRFIFYPVKSSLEEIYKTPITPPPAGPKVAPPPEEKPKTPSKEDVYREPIE
jgi:hypothetical protein